MPDLNYGTQTIRYCLTAAERKSMAIEVHPDLSVHVIAPQSTALEEVEKKLLKRATWILKQQQYFAQFLPRTPKREYVSGETHLYLGRRYQLKVEKGEKESVKLISGKLRVSQTTVSDSSKTKDLLNQWYYLHAERVFSSLYDECVTKFANQLEAAPPLEIRRMKNRWGSCTPKGRIILNPELIKSNTNCIRYVIIHEMCHLIEPNHNSRFYELQTKMMPQWEYWKNRLEMIMA